MLGVAPFVTVVVTEEPDAVAEPSVELAKESLQPVASILAPTLATQPAIIKVVTGIRRCGKSSLLCSVMDEL